MKHLWLFLALAIIVMVVVAAAAVGGSCGWGQVRQLVLTQDSGSPFPRLIFQTWKTKTLPDKFATWSATWKKYHPHYKHVLWTDEENRNFVKEHYPHFLSIYDNYDRNIMRVDAVRYFFLHHHGGIYADLDFESLKPLDPLLMEHKDADVILGSMNTTESDQGHSIPNAIMISKPKADFWLYVIQEMEARASDDDPRIEAKTGPILLKHCVNTYKGPSQVKVLSNSHFYPVSWSISEGPLPRQDRLDVVDNNNLRSHETIQKMFPESYAITYWTATWGAEL